MKKKMITISAVSLAALIVCIVMYNITNTGIYETLAITAGTMAYHFIIRLLAGYAFNGLKRNHANYHHRWYQIHSWENKLYSLMNVKSWKNKMPTFDPDMFNPKIHTWDEIAQAMCQSELVHETNVVLSFIPVAASVWFGAFWVFFITSFLGACFDLSFVIMQRYNRPRVVKIAERAGREIQK